MKVSAATYASDGSGLVDLVFDDGTRFAVYPDDLPRNYANELLDEWLAEGNEIASPA